MRALGDSVGELSQRLGRTDPDRDRDSGPAKNAGAEIAAPCGEVGNCQAVQIEEALVDAVDLDTRCSGGENARDPFRQVAVKSVVRLKDNDAVLLDDVAHLEEGHAHGDAEHLRLVRSGDHAAVIVGQDDNWPVHEMRPEDPFAGCVEVVAVDQGEGRHGSAKAVLANTVGDDAPDLAAGIAEVDI